MGFTTKKPQIQYQYHENNRFQLVASHISEADANAFVEALEKNLTLTSLPPNDIKLLNHAAATIGERVTLLLARNHALMNAQTHIEARNILIRYHKQYQEKFNITIPIEPPAGQRFTFDRLDYLAFNAFVKNSSREDILKAALPEDIEACALARKDNNRTLFSYPAATIFEDQEPNMNVQDNSHKRDHEELEEDMSATSAKKMRFIFGNSTI